ncbi:MAG: GNAT family N-acetyltransferase [Rhodopirellula sp.]|nr:GNAT family N-acetyltransferase [Rhodopirellula sp.]
MNTVAETERLLLRELVPDDLDFLAEMLADPEVMRFYPNPLSRTEAEVWLNRQFQRYADHGHGLWLVVAQRTAVPIGQVGLAIQDVNGNPEPEIGYLLHRPFWHHGFATEAALAVRNLAFTRFQKASVISLIRPINLPSQAVARRIGMRQEAEVSFKGILHLLFRVARAHHGPS